jgi:hypothetical protein
MMAHVVGSPLSGSHVFHDETEINWLAGGRISELKETCVDCHYFCLSILRGQKHFRIKANVWIDYVFIA